MKKINILLAGAILGCAQLAHAVVIAKPTPKPEEILVKKSAPTCFIQVPNLVQEIHINVGYLLSIETKSVSNQHQLALIMAGQNTPYRFLYKDEKTAKESMNEILELTKSGGC